MTQNKKVFDESILSRQMTFNLKVLTIFGLWNPYEDYRKWFYHAYTLLFPYLCTIIRMQACINLAVAVRQNFFDCTIAAFMVVGYGSNLMKMINLWYNHDNIKYLQTAFQWEQTLPCSKKFANYRLWKTARTLRQSKKITVAGTMINFSWQFLIYIRCFNKNHRTLKDLLLSFTFLKSFCSSWDFGYLLIFDYMILIASTYTIVIHDCLVICIMLNLTAQLKILNERLENCCASSDEESETDEDSQDPHRELVYCIRHYQKIYEMMNVTQDIYGFIMFPQLVSSVAKLTVTAIHVFITRAVNPHNILPSIKIIVTLTNITFQLVVYCWGGDKLIATSDLISLKMYQSNWYRQDKEFQTNLMIFSLISRTPLRLSAYGLFDLSLVTLKNVLTKSYSAMALLNEATG